MQQLHNNLWTPVWACAVVFEFYAFQSSKAHISGGKIRNHDNILLIARRGMKVITL